MTDKPFFKTIKKIQDIYHNPKIRINKNLVIQDVDDKPKNINLLIIN